MAEPIADNVSAGSMSPVRLMTRRVPSEITVPSLSESNERKYFSGMENIIRPRKFLRESYALRA